MISSRPISRDKLKPHDFIAALGFQKESSDKSKTNNTAILPSSCNLNVYAFELFFENARHSQLLRILSSDHIEHGFKIIAEAAQSDNLNSLKYLINRIFIFAFIEIFLADKSERASLFVKRQSHFTTFSESILDQLCNVKCDMADSIPVIFDHIMGPMQVEFGCSFYENIDQFIDESTAPAISFLLKPFLHNEISQKKINLPLSTQTINRPTNLFGEVEECPYFFAEAPLPKLSPYQYPFAKFKIAQNCPIIHISKPKFIPSQIPTITCMNAPRYVETSSISKSSLEFIYSVESRLFLCKSNLENESFQDCNIKNLNMKCDVNELYTHESPISSVSLSDCGNWALSCDITGGIHLVNVNQRERVCDYQPVKSCISCSSFSPTIPHMFAIGTFQGEVRVYSLSSRTPVRILEGHKKGIVSVKIHPNSEYLASVSLDATVRIWSITQSCTVRLFRAAGNLPTSLRISNNGKLVMTTSADGNVAIHDIGSGRVSKVFKPSENPLMDAVFTMNDQMVVGYDRLGNFFFWETNEKYGAQIATVRIDRVRIAAIECLSSDEVRIIGCSKQTK